MVEMTVTEFAKKLRAVFDRIEHMGEEVVLMRNKHRIARIVPGSPHLTAISKPTKPPATQTNAPATGGSMPDKWEALCATDQRVELSWNHDRQDMNDQSPSAYDMSLAAFAIRAEWTDAEVHALLCACRKHHGQPIKELAIKRTIKKVKSEVADPTSDHPEDETKDDLLLRLSDALGFGICTITRYDSAPPAYTITLDDGRIVALGVVDTLTDQRRFRNAIAAATGILPRKFKPEPWDNTVRAMLRALVHDTAGKEATEEGQTEGWLRGYLRTAQIHDNRNDGLAADEPWSESGAVHIIASSFRIWVALTIGDRPTHRLLCLALRTMGAEPHTFATTDGDFHSTRSAWRIPPTVWAPDKPKETTP
jgi:antitoxin (DNA-binding transcriptional repressor) of toxin-antitoxin stability system